VRQYDLLGRYGGEEFVIVSMSAHKAETMVMLERIMGKLRGKTFTFEGNNIRFTFSGGVADSSELAGESFSVGAMVSRAAKEAGRDRCVAS
jgi:diguanylate cyclase (GGDEF)-like protein